MLFNLCFRRICIAITIIIRTFVQWINIKRIDEESFGSGKLRIIEAATLGGYFSCDQVATILSKISFSSEKKKVIQMMANSIVGFRGLDHVLEQFNFDSDKREVLEILGIPYFRF